MRVAQYAREYAYNVTQVFTVIARIIFNTTNECGQQYYKCLAHRGEELLCMKTCAKKGWNEEVAVNRDVYYNYFFYLYLFMFFFFYNQTAHCTGGY